MLAVARDELFWRAMSILSRIFGSPVEPIFNEKKNGITHDILDDSLKHLNAKNSFAIAQNVRHFHNRNLVSFLFKLADWFNLQPDMKYWAVELFQRFLLNHVAELRAHVESSQQSASPIRWADVEKRLGHQSVLRAVSCIQLASKLGTHYNILSVNRAKSFLASLGFRYTTTSIVQSEIRVLKTLNFKVHHRPSPLEFVEALLGYLVYERVAVKELYQLCLKILDVFYMCSERIYDSLRKDCRLTGTIATNIEADHMLLAAAVIGASVFIHGQSNHDMVISCLSNITCIVFQDIYKFTTVLLKEILMD